MINAAQQLCHHAIDPGNVPAKNTELFPIRKKIVPAGFSPPAALFIRYLRETPMINAAQPLCHHAIDPGNVPAKNAALFLIRKKMH